jgi:type II secretory pathway component PulF
MIGYLVVKLASDDASGEVSSLRAMKLSEKASLYRELAKLVGASFHLDRSLELLLGQQPSHARRTWLLGLQKGLAAGQSVAEAVQDAQRGLFRWSRNHADLRWRTQRAG